jgi:hypothetical protein
VFFHRGVEVDDDLISFSIFISHLQKEINTNHVRNQSVCIRSVRENLISGSRFVLLLLQPSRRTFRWIGENGMMDDRTRERVNLLLYD